MYDIIFPFLPIIIVIGFTVLFMLIITIIVEDFMAPKVEIATKRVISLTIANGDVDSVYSIMRAFQKMGHDDRRLVGVARRFCQHIDQQRTVLKSLDVQDREAALRELLEGYDEKNIIELRDVVEPGEAGLHPDLDQARMDLGLDGGPDDRFETKAITVDEDLDIEKDIAELPEADDDKAPSLPNGRLDLETIVKEGQSVSQ